MIVNSDMVLACLTLVVGLPGTGKSTVARLLAEKTEAIVLNSDVIRRELFPNKRDYSSKETQTVIKETERRAKKLLEEGRSAILDALFTKQEPRDYYKNLAKSLGADFRIFLVTTDEKIIKERMNTREKVRDPSEATFAYYLNRKPHFVSVQGEHLIVDNSDDLETLKTQIDKITTTPLQT